MRKLNYDVARAGWVGDYSDPFTFLSIFRSTDGNNNTGWANSKYDELMLASTREKDVTKRMGLAAFFAVLIVCFNLLVDILQAWLNPRIRLTDR